MTTELVALERAEPLLPMSVDDAERAMAAYQELTRRLLVAEDWQGPPGAQHSFVKRRGWSKLATFYGLSTEIIREDVEHDDDGNPVRARFTVRATHPGGRHEEGDGACSITEPRFAAAKGRLKAEHDVAATARTRARNRAIADLIGFGQVSAEEVDAGASEPLPHGPAATPKQRVTTAKALIALHGPGYDPDPVLERIEADAGGYLPRVAARAVMLAAALRPGGGRTGAGTSGVRDTEDATPGGDTPTGEVTGENYGQERTP